MGERVHPTPLHYPSVPSFELHANQYQHDIQIPDKLAHKEQEQKLVDNHTVDEVVSPGLLNNEDDPYAPAVRGQPIPRRRRHRRCMCCCCCIGACVGTIALIVGILVLLFFLVLHPKLPKYTITKANISKFSISNSSSSGTGVISVSAAEEQGGTGETLYLNVSMEFMVRMENPNKKIGIDYRGIKGGMYYEGVEIGEGSIPAFYQGHKNTTYLGLTLQGRDVELTPSLGDTLRASLENDDSLTVQARAITYVRLKIGSWKTHRSKVRVKCRIQISNPTRGNFRLLHNSCKFKLLRLGFF